MLFTNKQTNRQAYAKDYITSTEGRGNKLVKHYTNGMESYYYEIHDYNYITQKFILQQKILKTRELQS